MCDRAHLGIESIVCSKPEFTGVFDAGRKIIKTNGLIRGSYQACGCRLATLLNCGQQGFSATLLRNALSGSLFFMVFETCRLERGKVHGCETTQIPLHETFICGQHCCH